MTASIFLSNAIPDPPQVSNVATLEDTQSGLISVLPNVVDASGPTIQTFLISGIIMRSTTAIRSPTAAQAMPARIRRSVSISPKRA